MAARPSGLVYFGMALTGTEGTTKLVLEVDITEAMRWGELAPGYSGANEHTWSEEQANYITGFVMRKIGERLMDETNQPCIDYADYDEMDYREGLFDSANYNEENVTQGSPEDNLMDMQESCMSVAIEIGQAFLHAAEDRGMDMTRTPLEPPAEVAMSIMPEDEEDIEEESESEYIYVGGHVPCVVCQQMIDPLAPFTVANNNRYHAACYSAMVQATG